MVNWALDHIELKSATCDKPFTPSKNKTEHV